MAAGSPHLDNVAPCLLGGLTMVLDQDNYLAKSIKVPENWYFAVILPRIEIKTSEARKVLPDKVPMADAIYNLRMISGLMDSVYNRDFVSFSGFLKDKIYSPYRAHLTPYVEDCKKLALEAGAYNLRVSGSGPAIFAPCKNQEICEKVLNQIKAHLENSKINSLGFLAKAYSMG